MDDRKQFYTIWMAVMDMYGKPVGEQAVALIYEVLKKYDIETIRQAISKHLADTESGSYPPKPADIIRQIEGSSDTRALVAWTKVESAIRQVGSWYTLVFDDPAIHCCIEDMGGWMPFATVTNDELPFLRNQFTKRYQGYITQPPQRWPSQITGETAARQVRFIGLRDNCQQVLTGGDAGRGLSYDALKCLPS